MKVEQGKQFLAENGLNLYASFDCDALPETIRAGMIDEGVRLGDFGRLILIGNAGNTLWSALKNVDFTQPDPIDHFSIKTAQTFITDYLDDAHHQLLYPLAFNVPLQQLGALVGWHHDSPLGLGIHAKYGVWFAYRVAFLVDAELPLERELPTASPCDSCVAKPCISSCPVGAVGEIGRFDIPTCAKHRLSENSPCANRCLSRMACPIGQAHRYPLEQIQYHYNHSIDTLREWFG